MICVDLIMNVALCQLCLSLSLSLSLSPHIPQYTQRGSQAAGMSSSVSRTSSTIDSRRKAPAERLASDPNAARLAKYATTRKAPSKSGPGDISRTESEEGEWGRRGRKREGEGEKRERREEREREREGKRERNQ